jgi:hypothetical protein
MTPWSLATALTSPAAMLWRAARDAELLKRDVHVRSDGAAFTPQGGGLQGVITVKQEGKGTILELTACVVATSFSHRAGIDVELYVEQAHALPFLRYALLAAGTNSAATTSPQLSQRKIHSESSFS